MVAPGQVIKQAREAAGLSQAALADRMGTTQSAVARLESQRSNPRIDTLDRAIAATGQRLHVSLEPAAGIDETLIAAALRLSPADRLRRFASAYRGAKALAPGG
jgi:transcriptional regulator with XRE-family HTH domain